MDNDQWLKQATKAVAEEVARFKAAPLEERTALLQKAGILNKSGKLHKCYRPSKRRNKHKAPK